MTSVTLVYLTLQSVCDVRTRKISLSASAVYVGTFFMIIAAAGQKIMIMPGSFWTAGAAAVFSLLSGGALGMGDAIVIGTLAFTHRPDQMLLLLASSLMFCFPASIVMLCKYRQKGNRSLPFLPFLLAGELVNIALQGDYL